ncbi:MAG: glycosyltransferase family 2 protein [Thiogranum sp.]
MKDSCLVSVIIVNHNSNDELTQCVTSTFKAAPDTRVIVVDNASTDESLSQLEASFKNDFRLHIQRNQTNQGFAVACNKGARLAEGAYLWYMNPDCVVDEYTLPAMLSCLDENPGAGMVGGLLLNPDGTEQAGGRRTVPTPWRTLVRVFKLSGLEKRYPQLFSDFNLHQQPLPDRPIEVEAISGACMLVRREALEDVGELDEGYFLHCEDLDWCMRFRQKGWKILFVPDARVTHYLGTCGRSRPVFVEWNKHKGMMRFYRKFFRHQYPGILMWLVSIGVWLRFGLLAMYYTARRIPLWFRRNHG